MIELLALSQRLIDRTGDVGAAIVVALLVTLAAQSILAARGIRQAWMLLLIIGPLLVATAAVFAIRVYWLAT